MHVQKRGLISQDVANPDIVKEICNDDSKLGDETVTNARVRPLVYGTMSNPFQPQSAVDPCHLSGPGGAWTSAGIAKLFKALDQVANGPADQEGRFYDTFDAALQ